MIAARPARRRRKGLPEASVKLRGDAPLIVDPKNRCSGG